jgi:chromosomal replication initiation ATPase DnaA
MEFLLAGLAAPPPSPLADATACTLLGSTGFVEAMRRFLRDRLPDREVPAARGLRLAPKLADVTSAVCRAYGVAPNSLSRRRRKRANEPRQAAIYLARTCTPAAAKEIGGLFGGVRAQAVSNIVARTRAERRRDRHLDGTLQRIEAELAKM